MGNASVKETEKNKGHIRSERFHHYKKHRTYKHGHKHMHHRYKTHKYFGRRKYGGIGTKTLGPSKLRNVTNNTKKTPEIIAENAEADARAEKEEKIKAKRKSVSAMEKKKREEEESILRKYEERNE